MANIWERRETVREFIFLDSKITADVYCSHEIKRSLFLGRKVMTTLDSIFKSRDITLPNAAYRGPLSMGFSRQEYWSGVPLSSPRLVKAMVFPVVMYGCESWTVKKAER